MSSLFGGADAPDPPPPPAPLPPTPTIDEAANSSEAEDKLRRRKGRGATILTEEMPGALSAVNTGANVLTGTLGS